MKRILILLFIGLAVPLIGSTALAANLEAGKKEFMSNCAVCHDADGKGYGPYSMMIQGGVLSDLTLIQRNNNGVFPRDKVAAVIDGRLWVKKHGPRDMPIWGNEYNDRAPELDYFTTGMYGTEEFVAKRVHALVEYLKSIQK